MLDSMSQKGWLGKKNPNRSQTGVGFLVDMVQSAAGEKGDRSASEAVKFNVLRLSREGKWRRALEQMLTFCDQRWKLVGESMKKW